jgi:hypothetical protein
MILPVFSCLAQNTRFQESGTGIEVTYGYGFIMPHHQMIEYFIEDHIHTLDIKINKATFGEQYWNQLFRYPSYGIGYYRSNLGNDEVFGKVNALYSFVKVPLLDTREKINIGWQIGVGVSYLTEHFDMEDNPQNLAIGSPLNIYIDLSLQSQIPLADKINLTNGIRFTHFSNGKVNSPNKGLNIISGSIGLLYNFYDSPEKYFQELPQIEKLNEYSIIYAGGIKSKSRYEPGSYYASSLIFDYSRNYSLKRKWIVGADLFYDETKKTYSQENQNNVFNTDLYQFGLHVGHEMMMGKLGFTLNVGGYLYMPVEEEAPLYSRIGLRYRFGKKFIANLTLKAHWAIASYIEWGIGYAF